MNKPLVVASRGDVESAPENTIPAFESAISKGADGIELDVHPTADGELIVHHFYNLGSTDNGEGLVSEHTLAELKSLDSGNWFATEFTGEKKPTLSEVFERYGGEARFEIDMKDSKPAFLRKVIEEVERFNLAGEIELTTAHYPLLKYVKEHNPQLRTGTFFYQPPDWMPFRLTQKHIFDWAGLLGIDVVHLNTSLITAEFVEKLHRSGFIVYGSNLNLTEQIRRCLELGIDSFSTGRLERALRIRDEFVQSRT